MNNQNQSNTAVITTVIASNMNATGSPVQNQPQTDKADLGLVVAYQQAVANFGPTSQQAQDSFEVIFYKYYPSLHSLASTKLPQGADDLVQDTFYRVWKRLTSGNEVITYLPGLIFHSFRVSFADTLEKLYRAGGRANNGSGSSHPPADSGSDDGTGGESGAGGEADRSLRPTTSFVSLDGPGPVSSVRGAGGREYTLGDGPATMSVREKLYDPADSVEGAVLAREQHEEVTALLHKMPTHFRQALAAQLVEQLSLAEIGNRYGWTLDQTKKHITRGRQWLFQEARLLGLHDEGDTTRSGGGSNTSNKKLRAVVVAA